MNLTEKGLNALNQARTHFPHGYFSAAELSAKCGEKIVAATLNGVVAKGYMEKIAGTPVQYCLIDNIEELIANDEPTKKGATNEKMQAAKKAKKDEFYTSFDDINTEVMGYRKHFQNKVVFCNCNDGLDSQFLQFFLLNFDAFQLKRLVCIDYKPNGSATKYEVNGDMNGDGIITEADIVQTPLEGDGSFGSAESIAELEKCDIVCTNPPFSLFRDFMAIILKSGKQFLVISNNNAVSYKELFPYIKYNKMWLGYTVNKTLTFRMPDEYESDTIDENGVKLGKVPAISWFTNIPNKKRNEPMILTASYHTDTNRREEYPKYDNYDAIEVSKVKDIPADYMGAMGVPITFLENHCPEQFEVLGCSAYSDPNYLGVGALYVNGKKKYTRIIIKRI